VASDLAVAIAVASRSPRPPRRCRCPRRRRAGAPARVRALSRPRDLALVRRHARYRRSAARSMNPPQREILVVDLRTFSRQYGQGFRRPIRRTLPVAPATGRHVALPTWITLTMFGFARGLRRSCCRTWIARRTRDVVDVSPGYLRNYLQPRKLAEPATDGSIKSPSGAATKRAGRAGGGGACAGECRRARAHGADDPAAGRRRRPAVRIGPRRRTSPTRFATRAGSGSTGARSTWTSRSGTRGPTWWSSRSPTT